MTEIVSFQGPEHCNDEEVTFLDVAPGAASLNYVRVDDDRYSGYLTTTFAVIDALPDGATDTGYNRNGRSLWLGESPVAAYLVSDSDADDIERWPSETEPITCA
ncbi:MAG TPA: hypothetical protein VIR58_17630 [Acidimicrobiales bacterium]